MRIVELDEESSASTDRGLVFTTEPPFPDELAEPLQDLIRSNPYLKAATVATMRGKLIIGNLGTCDESFGRFIMTKVEEVQRMVDESKARHELVTRNRKLQKMADARQLAKSFGFPVKDDKGAPGASA